MKAISLLPLLIFVGFVSCQQEKSDQKLGETINLPLTFVEGFGPGGFGYSLLSEEHKKDDPAAKMWVKTYLPVKGVPPTWRGVKKSMVPLNIKQLVYQNYKAGKINQEEFDGLKKSWNWVPYPQVSGRILEMPNIISKIASLGYETAQTDRQATSEWDSRLLPGGTGR